jgi:hypothetical protein
LPPQSFHNPKPLDPSIVVPKKKKRMPGFDHKLTPLKDKRPIDKVPELEFGLVAER